MSDLPLLDETWYKDGLHFKCTGCGKCCTGTPGYVWLSEADIKRLAKRLNLSQEAFLKTYTRQIGTDLSLKEDPQNYDCIFLKNKKLCTVYEDRPTQCKTFPFWKNNLKSPKTWEENKTFCEGIDHPNAPLIPFEEIEVQRNSDS